MQNMKMDKLPNPRSAIRHRMHRSEGPSNREVEIDRMCDAFNAHFNVPNQIHWRDLQKFAPLFSLELRKKVMEHTATTEESALIAELSDKFKQTVHNIYEPIHVVDDEGKEVMPPLPPLFTKLNTLKGKANEAVQILFNSLNRDDNTPMGTIQQKKAVANLKILLSKSQAAPEIMEKIYQFDKMIEDFNKAQHAQEVRKEIKQDREKTDTDEVSDDLLDFE